MILYDFNLSVFDGREIAGDPCVGDDGVDVCYIVSSLESGDGFECVGVGCAVDFDDDEIAVRSDREGIECLCRRMNSDCCDDCGIGTSEVCFHKTFAESYDLLAY